MGVLFRKIGGRIVPIKVSNVKDAIADASSYGIKHRKLVAEALHPAGKQYLGQMSLQIPVKGKTAVVQDVRVVEHARKKGISKKLFTEAQQFLGRAGYKFMRSGDIQHPAQVKIRRSVNRYKAGGKLRTSSRFFADQFGRYQEETRRVSSIDAINILKNNPSGRQVSGTTMIPKKFRGK